MNTYSRVYDSYGQAQRAVAEIKAAGVPSSEIGLMANQEVSEQHPDVDNISATATGAGLGATLGGGAGLLAGLGLMAIPGLGPVVAAGWLTAVAVGAVAGATAGGIIGALVEGGETEENAHVYVEAVRRGGTLVTVRTDDARGGAVQAILDRHDPIDPAARRADYGRDGWDGFEPDVLPHRQGDTDDNRMQR